MNIPSEFPVVKTRFLSHGTLETRDVVESKRFICEFFGFAGVRRGEHSTWIMCPGDTWSNVMVQSGGPRRPQTPDNVFRLTLESPEEVETAHEVATKHAAEYAIKEIHPIVEKDGFRSFLMSDFNTTWWEIGYWPKDHFHSFFGAAPQ